MARLLGIPGVNIDDHGERRLADGRWSVATMIASEAARAEIERNGMEVETGPPLRPLRVGVDVPGPTAPEQADAVHDPVVHGAPQAPEPAPARARARCGRGWL